MTNTYPNAVKLFEHTVSLDPTTEYREAGMPLPSRSGIVMSRWLVAKAEHAGVPGAKSNERFLRNGLEDTFAIFDPFVSNIPRDEALRIVRDPETISAIAVAASRSEESLGAILYDHNAFKMHIVQRNLGGLSHRGLSIDPDGPKCPYATEALHGDTSTLFGQFTVWAGELYLEAKQGIKK